MTVIHILSPGFPSQRAECRGYVLLRGVRRLRVLLAAVRDDQGRAERLHSEGGRRRGNLKRGGTGMTFSFVENLKATILFQEYRDEL